MLLQRHLRLATVDALLYNISHFRVWQTVCTVAVRFGVETIKLLLPRTLEASRLMLLFHVACSTRSSHRISNDRTVDNILTLHHIARSTLIHIHIYPHKNIHFRYKNPLRNGFLLMPSTAAEYRKFLILFIDASRSRAMRRRSLAK